jgi:hypothetical protein
VSPVLVLILTSQQVDGRSSVIGTASRSWAQMSSTKTPASFTGAPHRRAKRTVASDVKLEVNDGPPRADGVPEFGAARPALSCLNQTLVPGGSSRTAEASSGLVSRSCVHSGSAISSEHDGADREDGADLIDHTRVTARPRRGASRTRCGTDTGGPTRSGAAVPTRRSTTRHEPAARKALPSTGGACRSNRCSSAACRRNAMFGRRHREGGGAPLRVS